MAQTADPTIPAGQAVPLSAFAITRANIADHETRITALGSGGGSPGVQGAPGLVWRGAYNNSLTYGTNDAVSYGGSSFIATAGTTGVNPGSASSPNSPWGVLASQGSAAASSSGALTPASLGLLGWAFDPVINAGYNTNPYLGQMYGSLLALPAGTLTGVQYDVWTAGATLTSGQNFVGVINQANGNLIAQTADQTTNFGSTGFKDVAFTSSVSFAGGLVYVVFLANGTTAPKMASAYVGNTQLMNARLSTYPVRCGQISAAGSLTSLPSTNDLSGSGATNAMLWAALR